MDDIPRSTPEFEIDASIDVGEPLECGPHLAEDLIDAEKSAAAPYIIIENDDDLDAFREQCYMIREVICLGAENAALLEAALEAYSGKAFYDGRDTVPEEDLDRLARERGLVVFGGA